MPPATNDFTTPLVPDSHEPPTRRHIIARESPAPLAINVLRADMGLPDDLEFQAALGSAIHDLMAFAKGELTRTDLLASIETYAIWVYEMQTECPRCKGVQGVSEFCIHCKTLGWVWKNS